MDNRRRRRMTMAERFPRFIGWLDKYLWRIYLVIAVPNLALNFVYDGLVLYLGETGQGSLFIICILYEF